MGNRKETTLLNLLITGGNGFIGRNLVSAWAGRYHVCAPDSRQLNLLDDRAVGDYLRAHRFDAIVHTATTRATRRLQPGPELLDHNLRMYFNLARHQSLFGKLLYFGSGSEYGRRDLPPLVSEDDFDTRTPDDAVGFSKYVCAQHALASQRIYDLRVFGVFGPHEAWDVRFISNACCRVLHGLPIVIRQDVRFDYLYINDLVALTSWFLHHEPAHHAYNLCHRRTYLLSELAAIVAEVSRCNPEILIRTPGQQPEYSGDNARLLAEVGGHGFHDMRAAIGELYAWYAERKAEIDPALLHFDD